MSNADVTGASVIDWGNGQTDAVYTAEVVESIAQAGDRASVASDYAQGSAEFMADLRGAATGLGLALPASADVVATLRALLLASRDHEGETSERIIRAANGQDEAGRKVAHCEAMEFSGRRGMLDSARYQLDRGVAALETLRTWEAQKAARKAG